MGGVGKTQVAAEYAWRHRNDYGLVWWIGAETAVQAAASLSALSDALGLPQAETGQQQAWLWNALAGRNDWLLIYDNVTDPDLLAEILPPQLPGRVLITSRARLPRLPSVDVELFDRVESVALLHRHLPDLSPTDADRIAAALADLPLAIDQAGAYLAEAPVSVDSYLWLLADQPQSALAEGPPDHPGLAATVRTARARLASLHPESAHILDQFAFLAQTPVPLVATDPATRGLVIGDGAANAVDWLRPLVRLVLVRRTGIGVQLHRIVAALLRAFLGADQRTAVLGRCLHLLASATPGNPDRPADWPTWAPLAPHIQAVTVHLADNGDTLPDEPESFRRLVAGCASYLYQSGQLQAAQEVATATLRRWEGSHPDHLDTIRLATALAAALTRLGKYGTARELAASTQARARRTLGGDDPATLASATIHAGALTGLGECHLAKQLAEDTLTRARRVLGADHPDTLAAAAILLGALAGLGEYPVARELAESVLPRARQILGEDQPTTLLAATILASAMAELGEYGAAAQLAQDTLVRRRQIFGIDHPLTLLTAATLAAAHAGLGDYEAAHELIEDILPRARRILGDDHPIAVFSSVTLAAALARRGDRRAALELVEDALARRQRILGTDHPLTLRTKGFLRELD
jgi:tetratricopeptide (TPR) repeat protein